MGFVRLFGRTAFAVLACLSLWVWSAAPAAGHAPTMVEAAQQEPGTIAGDSRAHGGDDDLHRALQCLGTHAADHDHGQVMPALGDPSGQNAIHRDTWRPPPDRGGPSRPFLIERPPRA